MPAPARHRSSRAAPRRLLRARAMRHAQSDSGTRRCARLPALRRLGRALPRRAARRPASLAALAGPPMT
eukprot:7965654-Alexandrium_andersonii.AAC.1